MSELTISSNHQALEPPVAPSSAEALDALDDAPEVPAAPIHEYGSTTEVPAGYVSDAELLAWLQAKSSGQYGELDQLMDASNARSKLIKDLSDLKESLSNPAKDPAQALAELQAIQTAYAGTEHAEAIEEIVAPLRSQLENHVNALASVDALELDVPMDDEEIARMKAGMKADIAAQLKVSTASIDSTIKDLEHDDQLALVQIQALMSEIRETAQLTSNIIANRSQTSDSIVGNIRA